jgi:hypothetical protein
MCLHIRKKKGLGARKGTGTPAVPAKDRGWTGKKACKSVNQEKNRKKGPRWSWAWNQMGNVSQNETQWPNRYGRRPVCGEIIHHRLRGLFNGSLADYK